MQRELLQQERDGGDLVGGLRDGLLAEHETLAAGPGRDRVQRVAAASPVAGAARRLAVDGDDLLFAPLAQDLEPGGETGLELLPVEGVEDVVDRVVARHAGPEESEAAQEIEPHLAPLDDLGEIVRTSQSRIGPSIPDSRQANHNYASLTRVFQQPASLTAS